MASRLLKLGAYEAENQLEVSLRQAFEALEPKLRPPFSLEIPSPEEYFHLNRAILYGVLTEPNLAKTHMKHLHGIVTDGYAFFVSLLVNMVNHCYAKLVNSVRDQLVWVVKKMVDVLGVGFDGLLVGLMRQLVGGEFSDGNLWLCFELVSLLLGEWDCLLEEEPLVLTSALYVYLRLLADHCRVSSNDKLESLKRLEIDYCVKMLREQFHLCMKIGRDLIRLLQDLVHVPKFRAIWKDLVLNPGEFKTLGFSDISQLYCTRTSSRYFLLQISPEMETQLRFLLMHVTFGSQKRYQAWFQKKFLCGPEREALVVDIVRFICCAHHPTNETIHSDIIPRWAVIGWLLKSCRRYYVEANAKLALFYDWLFFDEMVDNIMNIEPAMLLMVCSIPKYMDITHSLLEFLLLLVENYDADRKHVIIRGLSSAFSILVRKGVVQSLHVLTACDALSPSIREGLGRLLSGSNAGIPKELQPSHLPHNCVHALSLHDKSCLDSPTPSSERDPTCLVKARHITKSVDCSVPISDDPGTPSGPSFVTRESQVDAVESLVQNLADATKKSNTMEARHSAKSVDCSLPMLDDSFIQSGPSFITQDSQVDAIGSLVQSLGDAMKKSNKMGLKILEDLLFSIVNFDDEALVSALISPEVLCKRISDQFESVGHKLFPPLDGSSYSCSDGEISSATASIIRSFIFSQNERIQSMLLFWSTNGFPVGAHLLSYASRLAYEAYAAGCLENTLVENNFANISDSRMPLLIYHVKGCFSSLNGVKPDSCEVHVSESKMDWQFVYNLVENAFAAYKCFLTCSRSSLKREDISLTELLLSDIVLCSQFKNERLKVLLDNVFYHLADLCVGKGRIVKFIVRQLDHADLVDMQFSIGLRKFSLFGENAEAIFCIIKDSLTWDSLEQHRFWGLVRSELAISKVPVEKIILQFFCSGELDVNVNAIAIGGLLTLCTSCAPTPELVGAVMLLPNNVFQAFSATALARWAVSNESMLFESLAKFLQKFENKNGDGICSSGIMINHSAVLWLLNCRNIQGMDAFTVLSNFSVDILGDKAAKPS